MQTFYKEFVLLINIIYWLPMFVCFAITIAVAWLLGSHFKVKKIYKIIIALLAACAVSLFWIIPAEKAEQQRIAKYNERKAKYEAAKAVFDEQCKKAGEKIYRTVDNVDGIMLLKVRGETDKSYWSLVIDPMWDEAAIANVESSKGLYIGTFLHKYVVRNSLTKTVVKKGYKFVDVLQADGSISRYLDYKGHYDIDEERDGVIKNPSDPARYAVTYENNVDPELRKHWVAGTTIKIIDRLPDELLAEKTIFTFEPGLGSRATARQPWENAVHCPEFLERSEDRNPTSRFVVTVLKP